MVAKKSGLGKGLDALIPAGNKKAPVKKETEPVIIEKIVEKKGVETLKITEVEPNREQPRKNFNEDALLELSDSIKQYGVIQPLIVQKKGDHYEIIAGERRWRAAKMAGIKEIPVIIKDYSDQQVMEISLIENIQREDLNPIEEAMAYKNLMEEFHLKQDEIAEKVSKSRTAVTNSMRLLKLDKRVQQMMIDDMISAGHARTLITIEDPDVQYNIATKIFDEKLSVRETEQMVTLIQKPEVKKEKAEKVNSFIYKDIEEKIKAILGTKVTVDHRSNNKGRISIEYYSNDELERILFLLESIK